MPAAATTVPAIDEHMKCIAATVWPNEGTICTIPDVAAVLPAASTDLRAGSVPSRLQRGAIHHAATAARPEFRSATTAGSV